MLRGSSGFYSYAIYEHLQEWPAFQLGETRIAFKLRKDKYTNISPASIQIAKRKMENVYSPCFKSYILLTRES